MSAFYIPDFHITHIGYNALNKSREDLHHIYESLGFTPLKNEILTLNDEKIQYFASNRDILGGYVNEILGLIEKKCKKGDYLFLDFPFAIKFAGYSKIVSYAKGKGMKIVFFIHDLDGVRFRNPIVNWSDSSCLDRGDYRISASDEMDKVLFDTLKVSKKVKTVNYDYWDYLCPDTPNKNRNALLCFAGNLAKSSFISQLPDVLVQEGINLYGKGFASNYKGNYCGEYKPEELVSVLDGRFGLVWDGKSSKTCGGNFGKYLRINTSHKFGLYRASRKPVVVWREGSLASFVAKKGIGISVSSLDEIPSVLSRLDSFAYQNRLKNVENVRKDVIRGEHLKRVILSTRK